MTDPTDEELARSLQNEENNSYFSDQLMSMITNPLRVVNSGQAIEQTEDSNMESTRQQDDEREPDEDDEDEDEDEPVGPIDPIRTMISFITLRQVVQSYMRRNLLNNTLPPGIPVFPDLSLLSRTGGIDIPLSYDQMMALNELVPPVSKGATAEQLASLPRYSKTDPKITDDMNCSVCLLNVKSGEQGENKENQQEQEDQENQELILLPLCSHIFHSECIIGWLNVNKTCPVCRKECFSN